MNIPNILTFFRLFVSIMIGWPFLFFQESTAAAIALVLFALASFTDFLDGYLARKWNQVSELGRMLDPIADKALVLMMIATILGVLGLEIMLVIPASIIIFREIFVSGMREFLGDRAKALKVTNLGKWKTATQMISLCLILFALVIINEKIYYIGVTAFWIAMILTAVSGADYARKAIKLLEK